MKFLRHTVAIAFLLLFGGLLFFNAQTNPAQALPKEPKAQDAYWQERIKTVGGPVAYEELAKTIASFTPQQQHKSAHQFGGALYAVLGVNGLSVCDVRFNYACYHEFLGKAIADLGLGSVETLNKKCTEDVKKSPLSCQHGIGHGIVTYLGYDDDAFHQALETCSNLPGIDPIGGCYGGVFMEYNLQTMLAEDGRTRPVMNNDWLAPCTTLAQQYKRACVFNQPQWWHVTFIGKQEKDTESVRIGQLCEQYEDPSLVRTCFEGFGNIKTADVDFDPVKSRTACEEATQNPQYQLFCKAYAANTVRVGGNNPEDSEKLCEGLLGNDLEFCIQYSRNKANLANEIPVLLNE